ncbi:MAG: Gldg family protein [Treponema sp.]|nr:Gldg family protein [Treponema sp.]
MKNKTYLKYQLIFSFTHPLFYILAVLFCIYINFNFFIKNQFFTTGTSDLLLLFSSVPYVSILLIPAICFRKSEAIYDSFVPLSRLNKLLANLLSALIQYAAILLILLPSALVVGRFCDVDFGQFTAGIICLLFYGMTVISVCIFMQELINSKIAALIISAVILIIINSAHLLAVYVSLGNFLTSILKKISFAWHFDAAGKGILDTRDIIYFASISAIFFLLTVMLCEYKDGKKLAVKEKLYKGSLFVIAILVLLNGQKYYKRFDFSKNKLYSLSTYTEQLLSKIDENIKITYCRSTELSRLYPQVRDVNDFLNDYCARNKKLSLIIRDPSVDEGIAQNLDSLGITGQQLKTTNRNSTEYINVYSAIIIEGKGQTAAIPFVLSAETLEYDLDSKLKQLLTGTLRVVNIVCGNELSFYDDYSYVMPWLNSQGFVCNVLYAADDDFVQELEDTSGVLFVLGDSQINIDSAIAIENYILSEKGNAFFAVSPYNVSIDTDWSIKANKRTNVVEMLENWGVVFLPEIAADISCSRITMYSGEEDNSLLQSSTYTKIINYPLWINIMPQEKCSSGMTVFWATPLELSDNAVPYLVTSPYAYSYETDRNSPERLIETNPMLLEEADISDKEKKQLVLCAEISGRITGLYNLAASENSHIIVLPDPYFVNTLMTGYNGGEYGDYRNFGFMTNTLLKLNNEEELAELQGRSLKDNSLYKINDSESFLRTSRSSLILLFALIPLLVLCCGVLIKVLRHLSLKKLSAEITAKKAS